ncbi:UNVERIFIED_CONTAM: hypothetical protein PYX00_006052 [Menopon gallinae]|uniref:Uncharacterized protein n=1 Tax=Menopon gallinae TaxID=328185 RepID=A0AAW2HVV1_9NEOP
MKVRRGDDTVRQEENDGYYSIPAENVYNSNSVRSGFKTDITTSISTSCKVNSLRKCPRISGGRKRRTLQRRK